MKALLLALLTATASTVHAAKTVMEGIAATNNIVFVDTANSHLELGATTYNGAVPTVSLYAASNVVVGGSTPCVLYSTGSLTCLSTADYNITTASGIIVRAGTLLSAAQIQATASGGNIYSIKASSGINATVGNFSGEINATKSGNNVYSINTSSGINVNAGAGTMNGIASKAIAFNTTPTNCSAGNYTLGIDSNGNSLNCTAAAGGGGGASGGLTYYSVSGSTIVNSPNIGIIISGSSPTVTISTFGAAWTLGSQLEINNTSTNTVVVVSTPEYVYSWGTGSAIFGGIFSTATDATNAQFVIPPGTDIMLGFTVANATMTFKWSNNPNFTSLCNPKTVTYTSGNYMPPQGCAHGAVSAWGGGGGGGGYTTGANNPQGGTGGTEMQGTLYFLAESFAVVVGTAGSSGTSIAGGNGGLSSVTTSDGSYVYAPGGTGGSGGSNATNTAGAAGTSSGAIKTQSNLGGNGGAGGTTGSGGGGGGGGGGAAGTADGNGANGTAGASAGGATGGGAGGNGGLTGTAGTAPGGGGGGGTCCTSIGGGGSAGSVQISWTP